MKNPDLVLCINMPSLQHFRSLDLESGNGGGAAVSVGEPDSAEAAESGNDKDEKRVSECSVEITVDVDHGTKLKSERDCRICQLSMDGTNQDSGIFIELGCSCKDDLGTAHKQCAESWFKIRGNKTCEICGSIAQNVVGVNEADELMEHHQNETNDARTTAASALSESQTFWQGHRFLNFLLACMVFAFVISWLFHFNMPS